MTTAAREPVYEVVWPLAPAATGPAALAARSPDLAGRTIGELCDYLFKGEEIFPLIRRALEARYPGISMVGWYWAHGIASCLTWPPNFWL